MNGAESLIRSLAGGWVDTCFANPGTSEIHLVAALDRVPEIRCLLGLFEGVVTGAADGYARRRKSRLAHFYISVRGSATDWQICTMRAGPGCRWLTSSASTPPIILRHRCGTRADVQYASYLSC